MAEKPASSPKPKATPNHGDMLYAWEVFDRYGLAILDESLDRLKTLHTLLWERVDELVAQSGSGQESRQKMINELLESDLKGGELGEWTQSGEKDELDLRALIGMTRYIELLTGWLTHMGAIQRKLSSIRGQHDAIPDLRKAMATYGQNLQGIWNVCLKECKSFEEIRIFKKQVFGEDVDL